MYKLGHTNHVHSSTLPYRSADKWASAHAITFGTSLQLAPMGTALSRAIGALRLQLSAAIYLKGPLQAVADPWHALW